MQTVESLIRELGKFPPGARCYAYEGESMTCADGKVVHSYIVVTTAERETFPNGGRGHRSLGLVPCSDDDTPDGPAEVDAEAIEWQPGTLPATAMSFSRVDGALRASDAQGNILGKSIDGVNWLVKPGEASNG